MTNLVVGLVPVPNKYYKISCGRGKRTGNVTAGVYTNTAKSSSCFLKQQGGVVVVASDLVFHFEVVSPTSARLDRTVGPRYPVLPSVLPLLNPVPENEVKI